MGDLHELQRMRTHIFGGKDRARCLCGILNEIKDGKVIDNALEPIRS